MGQESAIMKGKMKGSQSALVSPEIWREHLKASNPENEEKFRRTKPAV